MSTTNRKYVLLALSICAVPTLILLYKYLQEFQYPVCTGQYSCDDDSETLPAAVLIFIPPMILVQLFNWLSPSEYSHTWRCRVYTRCTYFSNALHFVADNYVIICVLSYLLLYLYIFAYKYTKKVYEWCIKN